MTDLNEAYEQIRNEEMREIEKSFGNKDREYFDKLSKLTYEEIMEYRKCLNCGSRNTGAITNDFGSVFACDKCKKQFSIMKNNGDIRVIEVYYQC
tara:strand:- start:6691 stop:6975 length:285 start_codon:yes stop_codon:yes gene_type:complete